MKLKVFIRVDGSSQIGLGHLVRCIALAHMLKSDFEISFYCKYIPDSMQLELIERRFALIKISDEEQFLNQLSSNTIVVLDGYNFDTEYQIQIKTKGCKLVCIDDLNDKYFYADLIINHGSGFKEGDYSTQPSTKFALGPQFALLRSTFLNQITKPRVISKFDNLFICFGGADSFNLSAITLEVVLEFNTFKHIAILTGPAYKANIQLQELIMKDNRVVHLQNLSEYEMLTEMLKAEIAIVPSSGIILEVFSVGIPTISGFFVDNQSSASEYFEKHSLIYSCGNMLENFREKLRNCISSLNILVGNKMIIKQKNLMNNSDNNLISLFKAL